MAKETTNEMSFTVGAFLLFLDTFFFIRNIKIESYFKLTYYTCILLNIDRGGTVLGISWAVVRLFLITD